MTIPLAQHPIMETFHLISCVSSRPLLGGTALTVDIKEESRKLSAALKPALLKIMFHSFLREKCPLL
jgi:hypothetical protein